MDTLKLKFAALAMAATLALTTATVTAVNPASYAAHDRQADRAIGLAF